MQVNNPLQMNDWEIKNFLKVVLAIQFAMWGAIGLDAIGLQIPLLRQLIGFIYLSFVPGIIILRILKLHKLGSIETLLYTVGLSIATLMLTGLLMNTVYPFFGIPGPISITPLIITISVVVLVLCVLCYIRDKDISDLNYIDIKNVLSPPALFLCLIPFLSIFGTYLVNFHHDNILLMFLIIIIALIVILIAFGKFIPKELYPLAVLMIAIALLWHKSLINMYLTGWSDVHFEYYFYKLTEMNSYWDWTIPGNTNAMLSVTILPSIYSYLLDIDGVWIFKIIYPFFFAFVPLGLYHLYQKQTDDRTAFLSVFFFMSFAAFYCVMISLVKQQMAMLFFVLLILSMRDKKIDAPKRAALSIIFSVSMVVSHYGTTYITIFYILMACFLLSFMKNATINRFWQSLRAKVNKYEIMRRILQSSNVNGNSENAIRENSKTITETFIILYSVMAVSWYMYVSSSTAFNSIVHIGDHVYYSIYTDFFNPAAREGIVMSAIGIHEPAQSLARFINRYIFHATQLFIIIGVIRLLIQRNKMKFEREYIAMTLVSTVIILMCLMLPFFSGKLHMDRIYLILLLFLSPFCILGGETVFKGILKLFRLVSSRFKQKQACASDQRWYSKRDNGYSDVTSNINKMYVLLVFIVLVPYFLFNTGFVGEVTGDVLISISLSMERLIKGSDENVTISFTGRYTYEQNVFSARWLSKSRDKKNPVYSDIGSQSCILPDNGMIYPSRVLRNTTRVGDNSYIYLNRRNIVHGVVSSRWGVYNTTEISPPLWENNKIYSNGDSEIYYYA